MKKERTSAINISESRRALIDKMCQYKVLDLELAGNGEVFLFAVAKGLETPKTLGKVFAYIRTEYINNSEKRAFFYLPALANAQNDEELDKYTELVNCFDICEECAESGFGVIQDELDAAGWDTEVYERRQLKELDLLFTNNVKNQKA